MKVRNAALQDSFFFLCIYVAVGVLKIFLVAV